jgi:hypothetical protein
VELTFPGGASTVPYTVRSAYGPLGLMPAWALPLVSGSTGIGLWTLIFASIFGNTSDSAPHSAFSSAFGAFFLSRETIAVRPFTKTF